MTGEHPFFCFSRTNLTGTAQTPRCTNIPQLSEEQAEDLDAIQFAADDSALVVNHEKEDQCFINNLAMLHGREAFVEPGYPQSTECVCDCVAKQKGRPRG